MLFVVILSPNIHDPYQQPSTSFTSFQVIAEHMPIDLNEFQSGADVSMNISTKKVLFKDESLIRSTQPVEKMINICVCKTQYPFSIQIC